MIWNKKYIEKCLCTFGGILLCFPIGLTVILWPLWFVKDHHNHTLFFDLSSFVIGWGTTSCSQPCCICLQCQSNIFKPKSDCYSHWIICWMVSQHLGQVHWFSGLTWGGTTSWILTEDLKHSWTLWKHFTNPVFVKDAGRWTQKEGRHPYSLVEFD